MADIKNDIQTEEDIKLMVDTFYDKVNADSILSPVFNEFAKVDWDSHLPRMYSFWNKMLFAKGDFEGNPFQKHIPLPVTPEHFERWISIFTQNIDEHFIGDMAEEVKLRAKSIAYAFKSKLCPVHKN